MGTRTDVLQIKLKVDGEGNVKAELAGVSNEVEKLGSKADKAKVSAGGLKGAIAGIITAQSIKVLLDANIEYERLGAILKTVEGSSAAASKRFDQLKEFAKTTPFQLSEVVNSYVTLKNLGINPTAKAMKAFGNISAGMGKDMQQVAEAVADATVGEFERLKEFGIKARKENDKISFSFRGTTTVVGDSSQEIQEYLTGIGENEFAGAMADQMDTLGGKISNLQDSLFNLFVAIGESGLSDWFKEIIGGFDAVISDITGAIKQLQGDDEIVAASHLADINQQLLDVDATVDALNKKLSNPPPKNSLGALFYDADVLEKKLKEAVEQLKSLELQRRAAVANALRRSNWKEAPSEDKPGADAPPKGQVKAQAAAEKLIATLEKQIATFGMSRDEMVLYQAEAIATATTDAALADQVRDVAKALAEKIKAEKAATETERKRREQARKARAEERAQEEAERGLAEALRIVDPLRAKAIERMERMADVTDKLNEAEARGLITREELRQYLQDLPELLDKADQGFQDFADLMAKGLAGLGEGFADLVIGADFKEGLDGLLDYFGDWLTDMGDEAAQNAIKIVFEGADGSGGIEGLLKGLLSKDGESQGMSAQGTAMAGGIAGLAGMILGKATGSDNMAGYMATGATIGAAFSPLGAAIGAAIGAVVGLLSKKKTPRVTVGGGDASGGERFSSALGGFSFQDVKRIGSGFDSGSAAYEIVQAITTFDVEIAKLLTAQERNIAELALDEFSRQYKGDGISGEAILQDRFRVIMNAVMPEFERFIAGLGDLQAQVEGFSAIRGIQKFTGDLDDLKDSLATDEITQFKIQIKQARAAEVSAMAAYNDALAAMDPTDIVSSAQEAARATIRRYQAEIQLVQQLTAMLSASETQARKFALEMNSRRAALSGDYTPLMAGLDQDLTTLRTSVSESTDTEQALASLGEFIATMDRWLTESRAAVERWLREDLALLDQEQADIIAGAALRQEESDAARQAAIDKQTTALEQQLGIAESWISVLQQAESLIDRLTLSAANPLSAPGRLAALGDKIAATRFALGQASAAERPELAQKLIAMLQDQLAMAGDIYQRPSNEYAAIYNDTIAQLNELRNQAGVESASMEDLQAQLIDLQQQANEIAGEQVQFSADEQALLDDIAARREALQEEANEQLRQIEERAREAYDWAQTKGEALQEQRHKELTALLDEITGGLDADSFIAQQQERTADLLEDIKAGLFTFLDEISNASPAPGSGWIPGTPWDPSSPWLPGNGFWATASTSPPAYGPQQPGSVSLTVQSTVSVGPGDPAAIAAAVEKGTTDALMRSVPLLKEELKVA